MDEYSQDLLGEPDPTVAPAVLPEAADVSSVFEAIPEADPRDLDGDGIVNLEEVSAFNEQQRQQTAPVDVPAPVQPIDPRDLDGDGIVNLEEVSAFNEQQRQQTAPVDVPAPVQPIDPRDLDGDGIVNLEEVSAFNERQAQEMPSVSEPPVVLDAPPAAEPVPVVPLDPRDLDGDGVVTLEEVSAFNEQQRQQAAPVEQPPVVLEPAPEPIPVPVAEAPTLSPEQIEALALERARERRAQFEALIAQQSAAATPLPPRPTPVQTVVHIVRESAPAASPAPIPEPDYEDLDDVRRALDAFGVESDLVTGATVDDLRRAFDAGRGVVLSIDGDELLADDDGDASDRGADRAFYVTDIDVTSGTVHGYVPPDGDILSIPLDRMLDAWADSGYEMLLVGEDEAEDVESLADRVPATTAPDEGDEDRDDSMARRAGMVMLPLAVGAAGASGALTVRARRRVTDS